MTGRATDEAERFIAANTRLSSHPLVPEIRLHLADAITPIWHASEETLARHGIEPPYWAFAWPGGAAMARHLLDHADGVSGRAVLDVAAGSGIAAIAAALAGAAGVSAAEIDPMACAAVRANAAANATAVTVTAGDPLAGPPPSETLILAGDVCYQRDMAARMTAWLAEAVAKGSEVWLADPGRAYLPQTGLTEIARYDVPTSLELEDRTRRETVIYRLGGAS